MNLEISVDEGSQVAQARREAVSLAQRLALDADAVGRLALTTTEAATNLVKHAVRGSILLAPLGVGDASGVEVIALDRGPGMANVAGSMRDGNSTTGSPGLGLGSMRRVAGNLDVYSQPGTGTVLRFEVWKHGRVPPPSAIACGGVSVAKPGESECGDNWSSRALDGRHVVLVVDGLGHGPDAAHAAQLAIRVASDNAGLAPEALLECVHGALRSTRGAAGGAASIVAHSGRGTFAGVGNIRAFTFTRERTRNLVSHNGTLGHQARKFQAFDFDLPPRALLVMHSDGLSSHVDVAPYPGLERHHPSVIAATLYRDHVRGRDDATIAVARNDWQVAS